MAVITYEKFSRRKKHFYLLAVYGILKRKGKVVGVARFELFVWD